MEYVVDMVRLEVRVIVSEFSVFMMENLLSSPYVEQYIGTKLKDYHYNFSIHESLNLSFGNGPLLEQSFFLAYQHNSERISGSDLKKYALVIEFNPNKCSIEYGLLNLILKAFFTDYQAVKLVSCDVCCDLQGISINNCVIDKECKRNYRDFRGNGGRTIYLGARSSNGSVKIYDKAAELGIDKVWTRWETTLRFKDIYMSYIFVGAFQVDAKLPTVYFDDGQINLIDDVKLKCAVVCVREGIVSINDFDKRYRQKIRPYLEDTAKVIIGEDNRKDLHKSIVSYIRDFAISFGQKF